MLYYCAVINSIVRLKKLNENLFMVSSYNSRKIKSNKINRTWIIYNLFWKYHSSDVLLNSLFWLNDYLSLKQEPKVDCLNLC